MDADFALGQVDQLVDLVARFDVVDLAPVLRSNMPRAYAHPDLEIIDDARTVEEHGYRLQTLIMPEHVGAHCDAPAHVVADQPDATVDRFEPTSLWGRAITLDLSDHDWKAGEMLDRTQFDVAIRRSGETIQTGDIVLVNFGWAKHFASDGLGVDYWCKNAPGFTEDVCRHLRDEGVRAVGCDTHCCDVAVVDGETLAAYGHLNYFLPEGIPIIETLERLEHLPALSYFSATPLKIHGGSGSPLRPVALVPKSN